MRIPSLSLSNLGIMASGMLEKSVLGIDIGSASAKVVQLSQRDNLPVLETYGEIDLGPFADRMPKQTARLTPEQQAAALMDLLHSIDATARTGGVAIPLSSALLSFVQMPKRDPEQLRKVIAGEARRYVPVPIETVELDWMVISEAKRPASAFDRVEGKEAAQTELEDVMLVAIEKKIIGAYQATMSAAGLGASFYEVEIFSDIRSSARAHAGASLIIDIGASSVKLSIATGKHVPLATHFIPKGGEAITEAIMQTCGWGFEKAENAKRAAGLTVHDAYTPTEGAAIKSASRTQLAALFDEANRLIKKTTNDHQVEVSQILLCGGGACMPGILEFAAEHFTIPVAPATPFAQTQAPIILSDVLREVGPKFAVAMGLALRRFEASR